MKTGGIRFPKQIRVIRQLAKDNPAGMLHVTDLKRNYFMTTKKICLTAIGTALFVVLTLCLQVPVFENYYLCLGYTVMMVFCFYFGPISSVIVGSLGVFLYCLLISGLRGMPGWAMGNIVIALSVSLACRFTAGLANRRLRHLILAVVIVASTAVAIIGVKSVVEMLLYTQPFLLRAAKNIYAFVADVFVMVLSLPICDNLGNIVRKLFPDEITIR